MKHIHVHLLKQFEQDIKDGYISNDANHDTLADLKNAETYDHDSYTQWQIEMAINLLNLLWFKNEAELFESRLEDMPLK